MLTHARRILPLLLPALAAACSETVAGPLRPEDFRLGGARAGMSAGELRAALGEPASVDRDENPYSPGSQIVTWHYEGLHATLVDGESVLGVALTGPGRETARGLRVGDTAERVRKLYGEPTHSLDEVWDYIDRDDESGLHVLRVEMNRGRVASIYLGHLLD